jgi:hypothetical protein
MAIANCRTATLKDLGGSVIVASKRCTVETYLTSDPQPNITSANDIVTVLRDAHSKKTNTDLPVQYVQDHIL